VEPIFAQSIRLGHFLVDRVRVHGFGDGLMECGVKECNALDVRQLISAETDDLQRGEVVTLKVVGLAGYIHIYIMGGGEAISAKVTSLQWREVFQCLEMMQCLIINLDRFMIITTVDDAMANVS
jgi:hypothetical protein